MSKDLSKLKSDFLAGRSVKDQTLQSKLPAHLAKYLTGDGDMDANNATVQTVALGAGKMGFDPTKEKKKKKKRRHKGDKGKAPVAVKPKGMVLVDEDAAVTVKPGKASRSAGWRPGMGMDDGDDDNDDDSDSDKSKDEDGPVIVGADGVTSVDQATLQAVQSSGSGGWKSVGGSEGVVTGVKRMRADSDSEDDDGDPGLATGALKGARVDSDGDLSPVRRGGRRMDSSSDSDLSPVRRGGGVVCGDGGATAATVVRDATGRVLSAAEQAASKSGKEVERDARGRPIHKEDLAAMPWRSGIVQAQEAKAQAEAEAEAAAGPMAIRADDPRRAAALANQHRWEDPMANMLTSAKDSGFGSRVRDSQTGVARQWNCAAPINRFNITPGAMWDGVDRGNGFEKLVARTQSQRMANSATAYEHSLEAD